jgi:hypothetical protein
LARVFLVMDTQVVDYANAHGQAMVARLIAAASGRDGLGIFGWLPNVGPRAWQRRTPHRLDATTLGKLTLAAKRPPASLRAWLAFHREAADFSINDEGLDLGDFVDRHLLAGAELYGPLARHLPLQGNCYLLDQESAGDGAKYFLYVGATDSYGEYPVLEARSDRGPAGVALAYPGFDVFLARGLDPKLARRLGLPGGVGTERMSLDHPVYGGRMREHVARNLGGRTKLTLLG